MRKVCGFLFVLALVALVCLAFLAPEAKADNCRRVGVSYQPYVAPVTYQEYVTTNYANYSPYERVILQLQAVRVNSDFYFSVGDEYRQQAFAKLVAQEYAVLQAQRPSVPSSPGVTTPGVPAKENLVVQGTPPANVIAADAACKPITTGLPQGFKEFVMAECQKCHLSGEAQKRLDLTNLDTLNTLALSTRDRMFRSVSNGRMPKGKKVTDEQLNLLNAYAGLAEVAIYGDQKVTIPKAENKK